MILQHITTQKSKIWDKRMLLGISSIREQCRSAAKCHGTKLQCNISKYLCMTLTINTLCMLHHPDTNTLSRVQKFKCTKGIQKLFGQEVLFWNITSFNVAKIIRQCSKAAFHHQTALVVHVCEKLLSGGWSPWARVQNGRKLWWAEMDHMVPVERRC
jgi:hypothetical protein